MRGFPKHLNTKKDYYYIKENFPASKWKPRWQKLLDEKYLWMDVKEIASEAEGVTDDTHRVSSYVTTDPETKEERTVYVQQEYKKNPISDFWRLNFSQEEVEAALAENVEA